MKSLYIFNINTRGALYGIGTYIEQLVKCVRGADIKVNLVEINASAPRFAVETKNDIRYILIPGTVNTYGESSFKKYIETVQGYVVYLLKDYISIEDDNIFHLNRMESLPLARKLKEHFNGRIVLTMHYTNWSLSLLGDKHKLKKIIRSDRESLMSAEQEIYDEVTEGRELINSYCDKVIAISRHSYHDILSVYGAPHDKVVLINNALQDRYRALSEERRNGLREKFHFSKEETILIFAGRVDEVKGIFILAKAFNQVLKNHPGCRLIIAGNGRNESVMALAGHNNSKITYMGFVSKKILYKLYSMADIGVVPSIHEEFGYVALEMMMHKLPVVVSDTTGLKEIIEDGSDGLRACITKGSRQYIKDLTQKISLLIDDRELRRQYGEAARKKYLSKYSLFLFRKQMLEVYRSL